MVALAGHVVENRFLDKLTTGPSSDLRNATQAAEDYVGSLAMGPTKLVIAMTPGQPPIGPVLGAANELLDQLYEETDRLLHEKEPAIHYLAKALIERDELIGTELEEVFDEIEAAHPELLDTFERRVIQFRDFAPMPPVVPEAGRRRHRRRTRARPRSPRRAVASHAARPWTRTRSRPGRTARGTEGRSATQPESASAAPPITAGAARRRTVGRGAAPERPIHGARPEPCRSRRASARRPATPRRRHPSRPRRSDRCTATPPPSAPPTSPAGVGDRLAAQHDLAPRPGAPGWRPFDHVRPGREDVPSSHLESDGAQDPAGWPVPLDGPCSDLRTGRAGLAMLHADSRHTRRSRRQAGRRPIAGSAGESAG